MMISRFVICLSLIVFLSSCATVSSVGSTVGSTVQGWFAGDSTSTAGSHQSAMDEEPGSEVPFDVSIYDEVNDGEKLFLRAGINSKRDWPVDDLVLLLTGTKDGEPVEQEVILLGQSRDMVLSGLSEGGTTVKAGEELLLSLSLPSQSITDYQLDLLWGREAAPYLGRKQRVPDSARAGFSANSQHPDISLSPEEALRIQDFRVITHSPACGKANCPRLVKLEGKLVNMGYTPRDDVTLALRFRWVPHAPGSLDLSGSMPQNEELIELRGVGIEPGRSKPFRFVLDRPIPDSAQGRYVPELRVVGP